jgi:uncharacterized protein YjbI with pentapeptide repeats
MANPEQVALLLQGADVWNNWVSAQTRVVRPHGFEAEIQKGVARGEFVTPMRMPPSIDLIHADLANADLMGVNLRSANLHGANLRDANLKGADLSESLLDDATLHGADLSQAKLSGASLMGCSARGAVLREAWLDRAKLNGGAFIESDFSHAGLSEANLYRTSLYNATLRKAILSEARLQQANLSSADLSDAELTGADLSEANLTNCRLTGADLERVILVNTTIDGAEFDGCRIYGISVWAIKGKPKKQSGLIISAYDEATVTVDDLDVAQFVYLLLRREKLRNVIDTITSKAVLILGRFTPERKVILDAIAEELRAHHLLPIIFDFERSIARDFTETIKVLAGLSLFVVADVSNPKSAPLELQATIPDYQIPFVIIIQEGEKPFAMLNDLNKYDWVLKPVLAYTTPEKLRQAFKNAILEPVWAKHRDLQRQKTEIMAVKSIEDFLGTG